MGKTLDNNDLNQIVESGGAKREKNRKKKQWLHSWFLY